MELKEMNLQRSSHAQKGLKGISSLYYNPETGFQSATKLYRKAKELGLKVTQKQVTEFIKNQETAQLNKQSTKKEVYNKIIAYGVNDIWQSDLMDFQALSKFNKGYKWLLTIIDIYSRYAWCIPLKTKSTDNVREAFIELFKEDAPQNLTTDNGKEFLGNAMQNLLKKENIKQWTHEPGNHNTLGIIERFNKTVRLWLNKYFTANRTKNWIDVIDKFATNYNNTYHTTIRSVPNDVFTGKQPFNNQILHTDDLKSFKVGDKVRIKTKKAIFDKLGETYSRGIYIIVEKNNNSYNVQNEKGVVLKRTIKPNELLEVNKIDFARDPYLLEKGANKLFAAELRSRVLPKEVPKEINLLYAVGSKKRSIDEKKRRLKSREQLEKKELKLIHQRKNLRREQLH